MVSEESVEHEPIVAFEVEARTVVRLRRRASWQCGVESAGRRSRG